MKQTLIVYFDHTLKNFQIVKPQMDGINHFNMGWGELARAICSTYYRYEVV